MKKLIALFYAIAFWLVACTPGNASAIGEIEMRPSSKATYIATTGFFTCAASCTDFFEIYGSSTKTLKILKVFVTATDTGTSAVNNTILVIKRSSASSGGTPVNATKIPLDSNAAASTANTCRHFTANPTPGAAVGTIITQRQLSYMTGLTTTNAMPAKTCIFDADKYGSALVLRGTGEGLCLNLNSASQTGTSPTMDVEVVWTEE